VRLCQGSACSIRPCALWRFKEGRTACRRGRARDAHGKLPGMRVGVAELCLALSRMGKDGLLAHQRCAAPTRSSRRLCQSRGAPAPDAVPRERAQRWDAPGRALHRTSLALYLEIYRRIRYEMFLIGAVPKWALLGTRYVGRPGTGALLCTLGKGRSHVCAEAGAPSRALA